MTINAPVPEQIPQLRDLWQEAFRDPETFLDDFFAVAFSPDRCRCVCMDGKVAAALYWFGCSHLGQPIAYIYAVATAKECRGQGLCHKLMEHTHAHLEGLGYAGAVLVPGSGTLFRLYADMGYQVCGGVSEFACAPKVQGLTLCQVDKEAYADLRRQLLPVGGVVQEGKNLDFLQTQATLYSGPGILLAARQEEDRLHGIELLGDTAVAPGILHALGCASGTFRGPGDTPFAMYRPLGSSTLPAPAYFGLPFD